MRKIKLLAPFTVLFLLIQFAFEQNGGVNPASRLAVLESFAENQTVRIDGYESNTVDWARTPDGHYYSNKAPGPALVAIPFYWLGDKIWNQSSESKAQRDAKRYRVSWQVLKWLSLFSQAIPFALICSFIFRALISRNVSFAACLVGTLATLFGNTADVFMNTFFGHGFPAMIFLALLGLLFYGEQKARGWLIGFLMGWLLLSDYSAILIFPCVCFYLWKEKSGPLLLSILKGAFIPFVLWVIYHGYCFGSPFSLPNKYQNPVFVDMAAESHQLWGIIGMFPKLEVLNHLLFGQERGLLFTQPWALIFLIAAPFYFKNRKIPFLWAAFVLILLMNAAFGGWHGGSSAGPRYLCTVLPAAAVGLTLMFDDFPRWLKWLTGATLFVAIVFQLMALAYLITPELRPLWPFYLEGIFIHPKTSTPLIRFLVGLGVLISLTIYALKNGRKSSLSPLNS